MAISDNIKRLRESFGLTQIQLGAIAGVSDKAVSTWERGDNIPRMGAIQRMADYFGVPKSAIIEEAAPAPAIPGIEHPTFHAVPLLGEIACGEPILAEENLDGNVQVDGGVACDFALRCKGDSMAPRLLDGDLVFIRQQPSVDNGQIAAVLIDAEATLKHVYVSSSSIQLVAENPAYAPIVLTGEDAENARILGKAVAYRRSI
ncbi:MAG: helix-turn-helix domain-containing protein [Clostridia bacterium]|nr:helix-turn-helix domain-containing protein [Clostridia bacterium]